MPDAIDRLDDALDDAWEALRGNPVIDRIFYTASEAADFSVLWHTLGLAQAIVKNDPKIAIALSAALGVESALINGPVKSMFKRSRPVQDAPRPYNLRQPKTSSFPSGHASAAMGCCRHAEPERRWCSVVRAGRSCRDQSHPCPHPPRLRRCGRHRGGRVARNGGAPGR